MVLEGIKKILDQEEFACSLSSATEEAPFERLSVFLGLDAKKRERLLEVLAGQEQVSPEFTLPEATSFPYRIQFRAQLPFKVENLALNQVASLLLFLNQFIDLPGFELDELEGQVVYRYVWIAESTSINKPLILSIMGYIMLNLSMFSETIESLAEGKVSFNDLLSQIVKLADRSPKNFS